MESSPKTGSNGAIADASSTHPDSSLDQPKRTTMIYGGGALARMTTGASIGITAGKRFLSHVPPENRWWLREFAIMGVNIVLSMIAAWFIMNFQDGHRHIGWSPQKMQIGAMERTVYIPVYILNQ